MNREPAEQVGAAPHFEIGKVEAGGYGAPHQGEISRGLGTEPAPSRHHPLERFTRRRVAPQGQGVASAFGGYKMHDQGCAGMEMPQLVRLDPVKRRQVSPLQQKIDRRRKGALAGRPFREESAGDGPGRPVGLPVPTPLRMACQAEAGNQLRGGRSAGRVGGHQAEAGHRAAVHRHVLLKHRQRPHPEGIVIVDAAVDHHEFVRLAVA